MEGATLGSTRWTFPGPDPSLGNTGLGWERREAAPLCFRPSCRLSCPQLGPSRIVIEGGTHNHGGASL